MSPWPASAAGLAALLTFAGGARAREAPPASEPPSAVFRAEAATVEVDVVVTDARGEPVRGLTRDDFQVFEEGARQEIDAFTEVTVPVESAAQERTGGPALPRDVATNEAGGERRIYVIVLDEAHTDPRRSTVVRTAAGQFLERHMAAGDLAAVVYADGDSDPAQPLTADKRSLTASVNRFAGRKGQSATLERARTIDHQRELLEAPPDPLEVAVVPRPGVDTDPWDAARGHDARVALQTLEGVARSLRAVHGRRKAVLWFSEGLDHDTFDVMGRVERRAPDVLARMRNVIASAARSNVAVYAIDPRGLSGGPGGDMEMAAPPQDRGFGIDSQSPERDRRRSQQSLRTLAEETGGAAVLDTNDLAGAYDRIVAASSHYYLLGYAPAEFRADGAFRRIEVRVSRPGLSVAARKGYARPGGADQGPAPTLAAAEGTSPDLRELLHRPWADPGLALAMTAAAFRLTADKATVAVTIQLPPAAIESSMDGGPATDGVEVSLIAVDASGRVQAGERMFVDLRGNDQARDAVRRQGLRLVRRLDLSPGAYQLRVAARVTPQARRGSVFQDLRVPRYADAPLAMSGVLLTSRAASRTPTPAFDDVVKGLLETPPTASRAFDPDDVLTVYSEIYDALEPAHDLAVTTRVTSLDGEEMLRAADQRPSVPMQAAGGGLRHKHDIRLSGMPPGAYLLRIEARPSVGTEVVARELSFDVLSNMAGRGAADVWAPAAADVASWNVRPATRIDRLEAWLAALEGHQPGAPDGPAHMVRLWTPADLADLEDDLAVLARVIEDPSYSLTWLVEPTPAGRPQPSPYSQAEQRRIRNMAREAAARCPGDDCAHNRIARRGAILHTDAAVLFDDDGGRPTTGGEPSEHVRIRFRDAQQQDTDQSAGHWELAQALLDRVRPDARLDETVRLWYVAAAAHGQHHERHTRIEDRAVRLFPADPDVLFFAGTFHETLASARMQGLVRSLRLPKGVEHAIGSERRELRKAEDLFRRALAAQPAALETRLRLGRVLHRLGRHGQAAQELRQAARELPPAGAAASDDDRVLAYFAAMFLGAAEEALGRYAQARTSYERAAALFPAAPTPHLALSRLALSTNDRAGAIAAAREAMRDQEREDPWWRYHVGQGRRFEAWLDALRRSAASEP